MRFWTNGLAALLAIAGVGAASAQVTQSRDPNMPDPKNVPAEKVAPQDPNATGTTTEGAGNLSKRLEQTDGVLKPPANTDPGIVTRAPVPDPNTTPVIRPQGDGNVIQAPR